MKVPRLIMSAAIQRQFYLKTANIRDKNLFCSLLLFFGIKREHFKNFEYFIRDTEYLTLYSPVVTICTTSLTFNNSTFCPHSVFVCFVWI